MADYCTNFSLILTLPDEAARTQALELFQRLEEHRHDESRPDDVTEALWAEREDWCFECQAAPGERNPSLWLHSAEGGIEAACALIQHLLQKHQLREAVTFEWSHDCSKPRTDAFGGGAAFITAGEIRTFSTAQWVGQQLEELKPHLFSPHTENCVRCGANAGDEAMASTPCRPPTT